MKAFRDVLDDKLGVLSELNASILDQVEDDEIDNRPVMLWKNHCPNKTSYQSQLQQLHCI